MRYLYAQGVQQQTVWPTQRYGLTIFESIIEWYKNLKIININLNVNIYFGSLKQTISLFSFGEESNVPTTFAQYCMPFIDGYIQYNVVRAVQYSFSVFVIETKQIYQESCTTHIAFFHHSVTPQQFHLKTEKKCEGWKLICSHSLHLTQS